MIGGTLGGVELLALRRAMLRTMRATFARSRIATAHQIRDAELTVLWALNRRGLIKWEDCTALISDAGIEAVARQEPHGTAVSLSRDLMVA